MRYRFDDFVLDTQRYELRRAGVAVPLRLKVFQVLAYLLTQHDRVVPKDELLAHVWSGRCLSDETLSTCITAARQAVGDSGQQQAVIQTRRGVGYRFVAPVAVHDNAVDGTAATPRVVTLPRASPPAEDTVLAAPTPAEPVPAVSGAAPQRLSARHPTAMPAVAGEVKPVTVLVGRVRQADTGATRLDPETRHHALRSLWAMVRPAVQHYAGTLQGLRDDGFVALFGAPVAQEDHARRAVLAALEVQQRLREHSAAAALRQGVPLTVGMGLHTGRVLVDPRDDDGHLPYTAVGDTLRLATQLARQATDGTILLSAMTQPLVQGVIQVETWTPGRTTGHSNARRAYTVRGLASQSMPRRVVGAHPDSLFVGRQHELAVLHERVAQVVAGRGHVVGVMGEPGMGKSRLLDAWQQSLPEGQCTYLAARCVSYGTATPYQPIGDLLRDLWTITTTDDPATIRTRVTRGLQDLGMETAAAELYLWSVLGLPDPAARLAEVSPQVVRSQTFATLHHLYRGLSQQRPLLLEVEDVHWIDPTSQEYLGELVHHLAGLPILLLVTFRPGYQSPWMDKSYATQLALSPLGPTDSRRVVQAAFGAALVPASCMHTILTQAEGNPFFLEELARAVQEQGHFHLPTHVPDTVHAVLAARLDRLPAQEKRLLQIAAVIGTAVPVPLLQAIAGLSEDALHGALAYLQAAEFLHATQLFPTQVYTFKHALTHEVAYGSLLQEQRRGLHARLVEILEALTPDQIAEVASGPRGPSPAFRLLPSGGRDRNDPAGRQSPDQVERLAYHALRGEVWDKAVTYCQQAGASAFDRAACSVAVTYHEQALQAFAHQSEHGETRGLAIQLRLALGTALSQLGDHGRGLALLAEAEAIARTLDDRSRLGQVLARMAPLRRRTGDLDGAMAASQHALALAVELGDSALQMRAAYRLGQGYEATGGFSRAAELLRRNVETADRVAGEPKTQIQIRSQAYLARTLGTLGAFAEGRHHGEEALRLATLADQLDLPIVARLCLGRLYLTQGDLEPAIRVLEQSLALCRASSDWLNLRQSTGDLGAAYALQGRLTEGRVLLKETISASSSARAHAAVYWAWLSEACRLAGQGAEAGEHARQALDLARQLKERGDEALALHQLGVVQAHIDPPDVGQAETYYLQALALAETLGMRPLQAHCHAGLGTLYTKTGQREQARAALSAAITLYRAMDMTFFLTRAEAALAEGTEGQDRPLYSGGW